jgi:hypothetical protein
MVDKVTWGQKLKLKYEESESLHAFSIRLMYCWYGIGTDQSCVHLQVIKLFHCKHLILIW